MEWLRSIDLSEFAPNLRGAGVHGGLIIYESAFNDDVLSAILSIPNTKTLLRRHIKTHLAFNNNLRLIVIYASSNVDDILKFISNCPLKVTVIVVANSISKKQSNDCLSKPSYQLLDCKSIGIGKVSLKSDSYDMIGSIKHNIGLALKL